MSRGRAARGEARAADAEAALYSELEAVYADAEALYAGWSCEGSTDCCHFERTGREPYVTSLELAYLARAVRRLGRALPIGAARRGERSPGASARASTPPDAQAPSEARRRLPIVSRGEGRCPLLDDDGRCAAYGARPIGCRTFWCDRATETHPVKHRAMNELVRRIQALAARHVEGGERGRPLRRALELAPGGRLPSRW